MSGGIVNKETPVSVGAASDNEPTSGEPKSVKEENDSDCVRSESMKEECGFESEHEGNESNITAKTSQKRPGSPSDESLVGKLRIKPFATLADTAVPSLINSVPYAVQPAQSLRCYVSGFNSPLMAGPSYLPASNYSKAGPSMNLSEINQRRTLLAHHIARIRASLDFPGRARPGFPPGLPQPNFLPGHPQPNALPGPTPPTFPEQRAPVFHSATTPIVPPTAVDNSTETQEDSKDDLPTEVPINPTNSVIKTELDLAPDVKVDLEDNSEVKNDVNGDIENNSSRVILTGEEVVQVVKTDKEIFIEKSTAFFKDDGISRYVPDGAFKCRFCYFAVNYKKQLQFHFKKYHCRENQYRCLICLIHSNRTLTHSNLNELSHHVGTFHLKEKRWVCRICFKSFKSAVARDTHHRKNCSEKDPYACHFCTFTCQTEFTLKTHLQKHDMSKRNERTNCPVCSKSCKMTSLASHMSSHKNSYICVLCETRYPSSTQLKKHYAKTSHHKPFRCEKCRFGAFEEKILQNHMKTTHPIKRTFTCNHPNCGKVFDSERLLNLDKKLHETPEDQLMRCPAKECDFVAISECMMKTHLNKTFHHRNFPCPDCTLRFVKEESLAQHIQTIHVPRLMKLRERAAQNGQHSNDLGEEVGDVDVVDQDRLEIFGQNADDLERPVEENPLANFARGWLGISGLGVDGVFDTEDQVQKESPPRHDYHYVTPGMSCLVKGNQQDPKDQQKEPDDGYHNVTPELSCFVECNQRVDTEDKQKEPDDDYHHVTPELSCLVECNQRFNAGDQLRQQPSPRDDGYHYVTPELSCFVECNQRADTEDQQKEPEDDYHHVTPELSCFVECNQRDAENVDFKEDPDNEPLDVTFPLVTVKEEEQ